MATVAAGVWRNRTRTVFTFLSILVAFILFGMLQGVNSAFSNAVQGANVNSIGSLTYTSLSLNYNFDGRWSGTVFGRVDNLFDRDPPFPLRSAYNDNNGRGYRLGVRFRL